LQRQVGDEGIPGHKIGQLRQGVAQVDHLIEALQEQLPVRQRAAFGGSAFPLHRSPRSLQETWGYYPILWEIPGDKITDLHHKINALRILQGRLDKVDRSI
jgi:hypothetical protein